MLTRIVKLTFNPEDIDQFLDLFEKQQQYIKDFDGCSYLILYRDKNQANVFFTYSHWRNEEALEQYRSSDFFRNVWSTVKLLFSEKPQAWSLDKLN